MDGCPPVGPVDPGLAHLDRRYAGGDSQYPGRHCRNPGVPGAAGRVAGLAEASGVAGLSAPALGLHRDHGAAVRRHVRVLDAGSQRSPCHQPHGKADGFRHPERHNQFGAISAGRPVAFRPRHSVLLRRSLRRGHDDHPNRNTVGRWVQPGDGHHSRDLQRGPAGFDLQPAAARRRVRFPVVGSGNRGGVEHRDVGQPVRRAGVRLLARPGLGWPLGVDRRKGAGTTGRWGRLVPRRLLVVVARHQDH